MSRGRASELTVLFPRKADARQSFENLNEPWCVLGKLKTPSLEVEEAVYRPGLYMPRHFHKTWNFVYIIAGAHWAAHGSGGETCTPGTVRFLPAGEAHEGYFPNGTQCLHIDVNRSMRELAADHGRTVYAPGELAGPEAVALATRIRRELQTKDDFSRMEVESLALQLLAEGKDSVQRCRPASGWLLRIRETLREEPSTRLSLTELSRFAGRHPVQISRQFHQCFGCTLGEYARRARIARAQSMLSRDDMNLTEIALACGFSDQSHFTNAFRRITGVPPRRYRVQRRQEWLR